MAQIYLCSFITSIYEEFTSSIELKNKADSKPISKSNLAWSLERKPD
jgi:hypothetical protein